MKPELREWSRIIDEYNLRIEDALTKFIKSALSGQKDNILKFVTPILSAHDSKLMNITAACYDKERNSINFVGHYKNCKSTITASYKDIIVNPVAIRNAVIATLDEQRANKGITSSIVE